MSMDRREFVKSVSAVAGTAALAGFGHISSRADDKAAAKKKAPEALTKSSRSSMPGPSLSCCHDVFQHRHKDDIQIYYYIWAIRAKNGETTLVDTGLERTWERNSRISCPPMTLRRGWASSPSR